MFCNLFNINNFFNNFLQRSHSKNLEVPNFFLPPFDMEQSMRALSGAGRHRARPPRVCLSSLYIFYVLWSHSKVLNVESLISEVKVKSIDDSTEF